DTHTHTHRHTHTHNRTHTLTFAGAALSVIPQLVPVHGLRAASALHEHTLALTLRQQVIREAGDLDRLRRHRAERCLWACVFVCVCMCVSLCVSVCVQPPGDPW